MTRLLPEVFEWDDVRDVEAYIARVVDDRWPGLSSSQRKETILEGFKIAAEEAVAARKSGELLSGRLGGRLEKRLIDAWRERTHRGKTEEETSLEAMVENGYELGHDPTDDMVLKAAVEDVLRAPDDVRKPQAWGKLRALLDSPDGRFTGLPPGVPVASCGVPGYLTTDEYIGRREADSGFDHR